jgi:pimeloyl-ACP methyl ester carboxylesterase
LAADARRCRDWTVYGADLTALIDRLGETQPGKIILAGHSLGAVSVTLAARGRSDIARLMLIEPVAPPWAAMRLARTPVWSILSKRMPLVRGALSRRARWPDRDSAKAAYAQKPLFSSWAEGCLEGYLEDGLNEAEGAVELACKPAWEAANYAAQAHDFWGAVRDRSAPMRVLASDGIDSTVFMGAHDRFRKTGVEVAIQSGAGHLLPMQQPGDAAEFLASAAG